MHTYDRLMVAPGKNIRIEDFDPAYTGGFSSKSEAKEKLEKDIKRLAELQEILYAHNRYSLLIIIQAMDAAGKDGIIKHVMSGVNPQGCQVFSFKAPSQEELDHDFMWRTTKALPERGRIGIFNRSYYEEVLIVRVHPEILNSQNIPDEERNESLWQHRFEDINNFERYLSRNGTVVLKFFLHVSKEEQKERFLERIERPEKNWKFSFGDVTERRHWNDYMRAYEDMLNHTSTVWAPWYVIPADHKWFTHTAVADVIVKKLESLNMHFPQATEDHRRELLKAKELLEAE